MDLNRVYDIQRAVMEVMVKEQTNTDEGQVILASALSSVLAQAGTWPSRRDFVMRMLDEGVRLYNDSLQDQLNPTPPLVGLKLVELDEVEEDEGES
jgi:hypothetical protein